MSRMPVCRAALTALLCACLWMGIFGAVHAADDSLDSIRDAARNGSGTGGNNGGGGSGGGWGGDRDGGGGGGGGGHHRGGGGSGNDHGFSYGGDGRHEGHGDVRAELGGLVLIGGLYLVASPYWAPIVALDDDWSDTTDFLEYPYERNHDGLLLINETDPKLLRLSDPWRVQFLADDSQDFALKLNTSRVTLRLDTAWRLGVETSWAYLSQSLPGGATDQLGLCDALVTFRFAQSDFMMMHTGLGMHFLLDGMNSHTGFAFNYGFDLFPVKPLMFSAWIDLGNVGLAGLVHVRAQMGVAFERLELYAGFDFLQIDTVNIRGPVAGLRLWL